MSLTKATYSMIEGAPANVLDFGAVGDGLTDDTAAIQAAIDASDAIYFPEGTYSVTSQIDIAASKTLFGATSSSILPNLGTAGGNVFRVTAGRVVFDSLTFDGGVSQPTAAVANTYIIRGGSTPTYTDAIIVQNCTFQNCNAVGGPDVTVNLLVTHCIYLDGVSTAIIRDNAFDTISGAAVFLKDISDLKQSGNVMTDVQWYNTNLDYNITGTISGDFYNCTLAGGVYWGGAINTVNNQGETQNSNLVIEGCTFAGNYSYGAVIRLQSDKGVTVQDCAFLACDVGSLAPGGTLTGIGVTTRNPDGVTPSDAPSDVKLLRNRALFGFISNGAFRPFIYVNNDHGTGGRSPIQNLQIANNTVFSPSGTDYFSHLAVVHGRNAGVESVSITDNYGELYLNTVSPVPGGIGLVGTDANGQISDVQIDGNTIINKETPVSSTQSGIQINGNVDVVRSTIPNKVDGCFYGVRTISGTGPTLELLDDQNFGTNTTDLLFSQPLTRYGVLLYGSAAGSSSIAVGTTTTQNITITGAALGDIVSVSFSVDIVGLYVAAAKVRVTNGVQILYTNTTGGTIDASGITVNVEITKKSST